MSVMLTMSPMTRRRWYLHKVMVVLPGLAIACALLWYLYRHHWSWWVTELADTVITAIPLTFFASGPMSYRAYLHAFNGTGGDPRPGQRSDQSTDR